VTANRRTVRLITFDAAIDDDVPLVLRDDLAVGEVSQ
jgi:hypothetical protein